MKISGVNSFYYYENLKGKRVLLLGDVFCDAPRNKTCTSDSIDVADYVDSIIDDIPMFPKQECLDIFIQGSYKKSNDQVVMSCPGTRKMIEKIQPSGLIKKIVSSLRQKRVRIHNTDPKSIPIKDSSWLNMRLQPKFPEVKGPIRSDPYLFNSIQRTIDHLLTIDKEENEKYFLQICDSFSRKDCDELKQWEQKYFKVIEKELSKLDESIITREELVKGLRDVYSAIIDMTGTEYNPYPTIFPEQTASYLLTSAPTDLYNLARMFIKFDNKQRSSCDTTKVDNVIIYSIFTQASVYELFFYNTFGAIPDIRVENKNWDELCIEVPDFDFWE